MTTTTRSTNRPRLRRALLAAGIALGGVGAALGVTAVVEDGTASAGSCSVPDWIGIAYGPSSDVWEVSDWNDSDYVNVGWICAIHDQCYNGDFGYYRWECDSDFHWRLQWQCDDLYDDEWFSPDKYEDCMWKADDWYYGVNCYGGDSWGGPEHLNVGNC